MTTLEEMLPADYLRAYRAAPPPITVHGPLPDVITHHYSSGGCFILAIALHLATGDRIELFYRGGMPRHAYITDGEQALDVLGIRPVAAARAGTEKTVAVEIDALVALLPSVANGDKLLLDIRRPASQVAAENAALELVRLTGWRQAAARTGAATRSAGASGARRG